MEMSYNFIECNREQPYLLPPSLRDWLPEGHLAWFVLDAIRSMDLWVFYGKYRIDGWGGSAYEPSMMVGLLLYAYCIGERSSRKIERLCEVDIAFRVITANNMPDHCTIARFRKDNKEALLELFGQVLRLCAEAGLVNVGVVSLDGTKVKGDASLAANRKLESIQEEVKKMLEEAEAKDREEDDLFGPNRRGDELPEELRNQQSRLARLKECKERLEREQSEARTKQQGKIDEREAEEKVTGKKKRGRKPKRPEEAVDPEAKANVTDPDSRIMKTRAGFIQGYNAQVVVTEDQIILATEVTVEENDVHQLHPMLEKTRENLQAIGVEDKIKAVLGDAGYWSEANSKAGA
jgi:transposase